MTLRLRILTLFGTRPEAIKLAPVIAALEQQPERFETINVASAQHTDLLYPFVRLFRIRIDHDLHVMVPNQTPATVCARVLTALDPLLDRQAPDLILVQGDTTTAMAGALAGFYRRIPVGHVEAGLRSGNRLSPYPEEMNRRLISRLATYHFAATERNRSTLLAEGVPPTDVFLTGNPVVDSLLHIVRRATPSPALAALLDATAGARLLVLTTHRRESFGRVMAANLRILRRFVDRHHDIVMILPVHPNPAVVRIATDILGDHPRIHLVPPMTYEDFVLLLSRAWLIVSDSGGVQEEAPSLGKPLLILRENTERPEAVECGVARLVGGSPRRLAALLDEACDDRAWVEAVRRVDNPFGRGDAAARIVTILGERLTPTRQPGAPSPRRRGTRGTGREPHPTRQERFPMSDTTVPGKMTLPSDQEASGRTLGDDEIQLVSEAIRSGTLTSTKGRFVKTFERRFAEQLGVKHAYACASGTAAVHLALAALDPEPGDEVITSPITDMGALAPILYQGAIPVFADVDPATCNLAARSVAERISPRTRAIIVTHLFGNPADMTAILEVARSHGVPVIEDCAQAFGARYSGRPVGTLGTIGTFSLQQGKHITTGEGGLVVTDDDTLGRRMYLAINKAWGYGDPKPDHYFLALNYRLSELQGAVALAQLPKLPWVVERRVAAAEKLTAKLQGLAGILTPLVLPGAVHSYWKYGLRVDRTVVPGGSVALGRYLAERGISSAPRYIQKPAFMCEVFAQRRTFGRSQWPFTLARPEVLDYDRARFPGTFAGLEAILVLPWNERYTDEHVDYIADAIQRGVDDLRRSR